MKRHKGCSKHSSLTYLVWKRSKISWRKDTSTRVSVLSSLPLSYQAKLSKSSEMTGVTTSTHISSQIILQEVTKIISTNGDIFTSMRLMLSWWTQDGANSQVLILIWKIKSKLLAFLPFSLWQFISKVMIIPNTSHFNNLIILLSQYT